MYNLLTKIITEIRNRDRTIQCDEFQIIYVGRAITYNIDICLKFILA